MYVETCFICHKTGRYGTMNFCWVFAPEEKNLDEHYTDLHICIDCLDPGE